MPTLCFSNPGVADIRALTILGVNVKEGSAIGQFGTGFKYALAGCLRTGHKVSVISGGVAYDFGLEATQIRGQYFSLIQMSIDGASPVPLGFTTDLGKHWKPWMHYRELWSNAVDEGGRVSVGMPSGLREDWTYILVTGETLYREGHERREEFILKPDSRAWAGRNLELYRRPGRCIFYQDLKVAEMPGDCPQGSIFTYNALDGILLTEDRVAASLYTFITNLRFAVLNDLPYDLVTQILLAPKGTLEAGLLYHNLVSSGDQLSDAFVASVKTNRNLPGFNRSALEAYWTATGDRVDLTEHEIDAENKRKLGRALTIARRLNLDPDLNNVRIRVLDSLPNGVFGQADLRRRVVDLSLATFELGTGQLTATLLEELIHIIHLAPDFTREFQEVILRKLVDQAFRNLGGEID